METMKAVTQERYGGPEVLQLSEVPIPTPADNEILVRVYSSPVTAAGSFMREGVPYLGRLAIGLFKPKSKIPGTGFSGVVESTGKDVQLFKEGDQIFGETLFGQGTYAEYISIPFDDVIALKPTNITHAEASPTCDGHLTSLNFLKHVADLQAGQKILIIGASGSLGTSAVQLAVHFGAEVTGVCSAANIELVKELGAHSVIDYHTEDFTKSQMTYDVIYDTVGKSSFSECKPILAKKGTYMSPVLDFKLLCQMLWTSKLNNKKAKFSATGILPKKLLNTMLLAIKDLISDGTLRTVMDRKYMIDQISEASSYVDTGRKKGNVVIMVDHH